MAGYEDNKRSPLELRIIRKRDEADDVEYSTERPPPYEPPPYQPSPRVCVMCEQMGEGLRAPKLLQGGCAYCLPCLIKHFSGISNGGQSSTSSPVEDNSVLPTMGVPAIVQDQDIDLLHQYCDVCPSTGPRARAVSYCEECGQHHCTRHKMVHGETKPDHSPAVTTPHQGHVVCCIQHKDQPIVKACKSCYHPLCDRCLDTPSVCPSRGSQQHHVDCQLDILVDVIRRRLSPLDSEVKDKVARLKELSTECDQLLGRFEEETVRFRQAIEDTKVDQTMGIIEKYQGLERDLVTRRRGAKKEMARFKLDVDEQLSSLESNLQKLTVGLAVDQKGHVLSGYKKAKSLVRQEPTVTVEDVHADADGEHREIEMKVELAAGHHLREKFQKIPKPTKIEEVDSIMTLEQCLSVCQYHSKTYIGHCKGVDLVVEDDELQPNFIQTGGAVLSIVIHNELIYLLVNKGSKLHVCVYDMRGNHLNRDWIHEDRIGVSIPNKMTIAGDRVIIPNRGDRTLTIYSLEGELLHPIPCELLGECSTFICTLNASSVVIAHRNSLVFRVNLVTEQIMWRHKADMPLCIAPYGCDFLLVKSGKPDAKVNLQVLNVETGKVEGSLSTAARKKKNRIQDMRVAGRSLIFPCKDERVVVFYHLDSK